MTISTQSNVYSAILAHMKDVYPLQFERWETIVRVENHEEGTTFTGYNSSCRRVTNTLDETLGELLERGKTISIEIDGSNVVFERMGAGGPIAISCGVNSVKAIVEWDQDGGTVTLEQGNNGRGLATMILAQSNLTVEFGEPALMAALRPDIRNALLAL